MVRRVYGPMFGSGGSISSAGRDLPEDLGACRMIKNSCKKRQRLYCAPYAFWLLHLMPLRHSCRACPDRSFGSLIWKSSAKHRVLCQRSAQISARAPAGITGRDDPADGTLLCGCSAVFTVADRAFISGGRSSRQRLVGAGCGCGLRHSFVGRSDQPCTADL